MTSGLKVCTGCSSAIVTGTAGAIIYDATVPNFDLNEAHWNNFITSSVEIPIADRLAVAYAAVADAIHLCREGAVPVTIADEHPVHTFNPDVISLTSYDETTDLTDSFTICCTNTTFCFWCIF